MPPAPGEPGHHVGCPGMIDARSSAGVGCGVTRGFGLSSWPSHLCVIHLLIAHATEYLLRKQ